MSNTEPVRVVISSDQPIYRRGLVSVVMALKGVQLVGEAQDESETRQLIDLVAPDLILLDLNRPLEICRKTARSIQEKWPHVGVVLFIDPREETQVPVGLDAEGIFYFPKDIAEAEFNAAVLRVGGKYRSGLPKSHFESGPDRGEVGQERELGVNRIAATARDQASQTEGEILAREMVMAGKIQSDILPEKAPTIPGWDFSAELESARETSGDFYDFIPLANKKWGIVVADVTDKGMGAALFMALSSTLIRTFAARYPTLPALTMEVVNDRILSDTRGGMFVTAFFGILEPLTGRFRFVNAGHPPAYLISNQKGKPVDRLRPTGMALGLMEKAHWQQKIVRLNPGDVLLLYTDGVTEAQNPQGKFFGEQRLLDVVRANRSCSARQIQQAVLSEVHSFVGETPRQDDIALVVICRKE